MAAARDATNNPYRSYNKTAPETPGLAESHKEEDNDDEKKRKKSSGKTNDFEFDKRVENKTQSTGRIPVSLEEIYRKHQAKLEEETKPKFISKHDKEKEAIEKRKQELEMRNEKLSKARKSFQNFILNKSNTKRLYQQAVNKAEIIDEASKQKEKMVDDAIKNRYLGLQKPRKKRKIKDRKFIFDWDENEDTSTDYNSLYEKTHQIQMYGRGFIAGIDMRQQKQSLSSQFLNKQTANNHGKSNVSKDEFETTMKEIKEEQELTVHWSKKTLKEMTSRDWRIMKEDFDITTKGGNIPNPLRKWEECKDLKKSILKVITRSGYAEPTAIQRQAIPAALSNRDVIGIAETGSGKTLAFLIPLIVWLLNLNPEDRENCAEEGPLALILAPTRELVHQIYEVLDQMATPLGIKSTSITGGTYKEVQSLKLKVGVEIVVATPGRLVDLINRNFIVLMQCVYIVMDEADKMIDMGFEGEVQRILDSLPVTNLKPDTEESENNELLYSNFLQKHKYRQTFMFTATMSPSIERLAKRYIRRPVTIYIGVAGKPTERIEQIIYMTTENGKREKLMGVLRSNVEPPIIIFVNQKKGTEVLARSLEKLGFKATSLHGGKIQDFRETALEDLKNGTKDILVATDLAGRGLDIKNVGLVINYDMPKNIDSYVHRIGRTGRAGNKGLAISFVTSQDDDILYDLKKMLEQSKLSSVPRELAQHPSAQHKPGSFANLHTASKSGD
ncbi:MAG: DEAD (Asp-Glu-Ala-Asp) box polypeptide 23 [Marteilia pararefringens]